VAAGARVAGPAVWTAGAEPDGRALTTMINAGMRGRARPADAPTMQDSRTASTPAAQRHPPAPAGARGPARRPGGSSGTTAADWRAASGDPELDALVRVAAAVAGTARATVNLLDAEVQCQIGSFGFEGGESPASESMCALHLPRAETVSVPDARRDPRYRDNPWVDGRRAAVRLYASLPLVPLVPPGAAAPLGTLCVFDDEPGSLDDTQLARLEDLALAVTTLLERRREARLSARLADEADEQRDLAELVIAELAARSEEIEERTELTETVLDTIDVAVVACGPGGRVTLFNRAAQRWHGLDADPAVDPEQLAGRYDLFEADGTTPLAPEGVPVRRALAEGVVDDVELVIAPAGQPARSVVASGRAMRRADGAPLGAVVVLTDVTADREHRRLVGEAHRALEERGALLEREVASRRAAQDQLATANAELQRLLLVDGLTGLSNRPCLDDHLARQWRAHRRRGVPLSVLMVDVDHFKLYNDTHGHLGGDECLRRVAGLLGDVVERGGDLVARYGGEEFAVVLSDTDAAGAAVVARRLVRAVREAGLPHGGLGATGRVTISVGSATWLPGTGLRAARGDGPGRSATALLAAADAALYAAKAAGRDTARHADDLLAEPLPVVAHRG